MSGKINQTGATSGSIGTTSLVAGDVTLAGTQTLTNKTYSVTGAVFPSGHVVNHKNYTNSTRQTSTATNQGDFWTVTYTKLLGSGVSTLVVNVTVAIHGPSNGNSMEYITIGGTKYASFSYAYGTLANYADSNYQMLGTAAKADLAAGSVTIGYGSDLTSGDLCQVIQPNASDETRNNQKVSTIVVTEVMA